MRLLYTVILLLSLFLNTLYAKEDRVALVIGNSLYEDAPLKNPETDAQAIADSLDKLGFTVLLALNQNLEDLLYNMEDFKKIIPQASLVLIYYAGHAIESQGENYLIPLSHKISTTRDISQRAYPLNNLLALLDKSQAKAKVVILDACRNNPFATRFSSSSSGGLHAIESASVGTLISFATSPSKIAYDGKGLHSPFTQGLLQAFSHPELSLTEMLIQVQSYVVEATKGKQVPWNMNSLITPIYLQDKGPMAPYNKALPSTGSYLGPRDERGLFHGVGEYRWIEKGMMVKSYKGGWSHGHEEGKGVLTDYLTGVVLEGVWKEGKKQGSFFMKSGGKKTPVLYFNDKKVTVQEYIALQRSTAPQQLDLKTVKVALLALGYPIEKIAFIFSKEKESLQKLITSGKKLDEIIRFIECEYSL